MNTAIGFRPLASIALVVAGAFGSWLPAEAARFVGRFDPVYGAPFTAPPVFWSGSIDVTTSNACASTPGPVFSNFSPGGNCVMTINAASVTFSQVALDINSNPIAGALIETLSFTGGVVSQMTFSSTLFVGPPIDPTNTVRQLESLISYPLNPQVSTKPQLRFPQSSPLALDQAYFSLAFLPGNVAQLYWFKNNPGPSTVVTPPSNLSTNMNAFNPCAQPWNGTGNCGWSSAAATAGSGADIIWSPVPEPEAYGLALAGAAVVGLSMLRRRKSVQ